MWCGRCQQDVPAMRSGGVAALCPRCGQRLGDSASAGHASVRPDDSGVSLEAFDRSVRIFPLAPDGPLSGDSAEKLRRLGHKLRPVLRVDRPAGLWRTPGLWPGVGAEVQEAVAAESTPPPPSPRVEPLRVRPSWGISILLAAGMLFLLGGVGAVAWAAAFPESGLAQWGITTAIAGEGLVIIALARITMRVWRNSRRLLVQIDGVQGKLSQFEQLRTPAGMPGPMLPASAAR
jgi:hypothetical protein